MPQRSNQKVFKMQRNLRLDLVFLITILKFYWEIITKEIMRSVNLFTKMWPSSNHPRATLSTSTTMRRFKTNSNLHLNLKQSECLTSTRVFRSSRGSLPRFRAPSSSWMSVIGPTMDCWPLPSSWARASFSLLNWRRWRTRTASTFKDHREWNT